MLDRSIPFYNTIMKCSDYGYREIELPEGFSIVSYRAGYEKGWARLEFSLYSNILFALNENNDVVGSCIAWQDMRGASAVSSLHWLVVDEKYQGIGLGRALCIAVMNIYAEQGNMPVYIHTQPWSWKAIMLYHSLGFNLQKTDTFSHYLNEYEKAIAELRKNITEEQYDLLQNSAED